MTGGVSHGISELVHGVGQSGNVQRSRAAWGRYTRLGCVVCCLGLWFGSGCLAPVHAVAALVDAVVLAAPGQVPTGSMERSYIAPGSVCYSADPDTYWLSQSDVDVPVTAQPPLSVFYSRSRDNLAQGLITSSGARGVILGAQGFSTTRWDDHIYTPASGVGFGPSDGASMLVNGLSLQARGHNLVTNEGDPTYQAQQGKVGRQHDFKAVSGSTLSSSLIVARPSLITSGTWDLQTVCAVGISGLDSVAGLSRTFQYGVSTSTVEALDFYIDTHRRLNEAGSTRVATSAHLRSSMAFGMSRCTTEQAQAAWAEASKLTVEQIQYIVDTPSAVPSSSVDTSLVVDPNQGPKNLDDFLKWIATIFSNLKTLLGDTSAWFWFLDPLQGWA